ncbi:M81 family metallopeptidase [Arthrobacter sp. B2a2-09]|uniref:M81 family metallopeptidase n=1 Tax=Arthrobacter sp. B2a2-09 TaxID=2952822 RepID=UPI0022CD90B9|nr:M81 family metallopeptidase [Arthrobacter sp. B2a2-09]MCZ9883279.1 M81 family metallopeptidase [Arthrobacter sp. B2a2-09]
MMEKKPRILITGIALEASTYSPARTRMQDFVRRDGQEILDQYPFFAPGHPVREAADWLPLVHFRAIPGGAVPSADYAEMKRTILSAAADALDEGPVDGLYFDIHGAMSVDGTDDPEGDLLLALRGLLGPDVLVSSGMDLHGNVSWTLAHQLDIPSCYRMAPHEDWLETKERAAANLLERLALPEATRRPLKAWVPVPILLPGEKTSTRLEPAKSLYEEVAVIAGQPGVLDAALWIGYAWADEPRNRAVVMVTGDDADAVARHAGGLAVEMWNRRDEFRFVAPSAPLAECLAAAEASTKRPYFISDSGDNPTAGGAGDVTWTLHKLLEHPPVAAGTLQAIYASIPDAAALDACIGAGVGGSVSVDVGARVDGTQSGPARLDGIVEHLAHGDPVALDEAVIRVGGLRVIVTRRRKPYHLESDFLRNGLDARAADVVVVKIGYLEPELFDMAADWMLALTPGGVDQDLHRLGHQRIARPMFPFDDGSAAPDLAARLVPASNQPAGVER